MLELKNGTAFLALLVASSFFLTLYFAVTGTHNYNTYYQEYKGIISSMVGFYKDLNLKAEETPRDYRNSYFTTLLSCVV